MRNARPAKEGREMTAREILAAAVAEERGRLAEHEAYEVCRAYDIPVPEGLFVREPEWAGELCANLRYPVVLKIVSPEIVHKSDVGGVVVGVKSPGEVQAACDRMLGTVRERAGDVPIDGILVNAMISGGIEVVIGGMNHPQFQSVVMFGLGGVYVEVFRDIAFRLAPLSEEEALRQIRSTKACALLSGARGAAPCDLNALARMIVNTGRLLVENPEVKEIDLNPVMASPEGGRAADARIIL